MRRGVAENPSTPVAVLKKLAEDTNEDVRMNVAENPSTPVALLQKLARDNRSSVRGRVYNNPNATDEIRAQAVLLGIDEDDD
jgi:hypothetical protein